MVTSSVFVPRNADVPQKIIFDNKPSKMAYFGHPPTLIPINSSFQTMFNFYLYLSNIKSIGQPSCKQALA
jgi:hypothetical protein